MASKFALASPASFSSNSLLTEFPSLTGLGWAAFFGDGTVNSLDGTNLAGTGAFTNVGSGPVLSSNYGRFTCATNGLQTPTPDAVSFTVLSVVRFNTSFAVIAGVDDLTFNADVKWTAAGILCGGYSGINGATLSGTFAGQWICVAVTKGPNAAYGTLYNLSTGASANSSLVSAGAKASANWQIGSKQTTPSGYTHPSDIAFSLGVPLVMSGAQMTQAYNSLKAIMAKRSITVT